MAADSVLPVLLNKGIDTVTPAMVAEPGTLSDCLNYEMTADVGYRRIDGYETYDGWINGAIVDYYVVNVDMVDPAVIPSLVPGQLLVDFTTKHVVAVAIDYEGDDTSGYLTYVPVNQEAPIIPLSTQLTTSIAGTHSLTTLASAEKGSVIHTAETFAANVREYATSLRNLITPFPGKVAGLHWHRNNLVAAIDAPKMTMTVPNSTDEDNIKENAIIGYGTNKYRVIDRAFNETTNVMTLHLEPYGTQTNNTSVRIYASDGTTVWYTLVSPTGIVVDHDPVGGSDWAYLIALNNPETSETRGYRILPRTFVVEYTAGTNAMLANANWSWYVRIDDGTGSGGFGVVVDHVSTGGNYATNTGTGYLEMLIYAGGSGWNYPYFGDSIKSESSVVMGQVGNVVDIAKIAGTKRLRTNETRYTGITANFYGDSLRTESYVATGASRAAWIRAYDDPLTKDPWLDAPAGAGAISDSNQLDWAWGNIITIFDSESKDMPKYVAYHANRLALGFDRGSIMISVAGEPRNFNGGDGAMEISAGDTITGLVEAVEDTLIVFGARSIRRINGTSMANMTFKAIVPNSGAFDYTCLNVAGTPVFTGPNGISTLQQAQEFGDFVGARTTEKVVNTFVPKLVNDWTDSEAGSVAMALPVRSKNQYRLWLTTGEVYVVCFTAEGPKVMKSNYGTYTGPGDPDTLNVPFAWCSALSDSMKERIHVAWDDLLSLKTPTITGEEGYAPSAHNIYELDRGWGFKGVTFEAWFELAHIYPSKGVQTGSIEKVRMYGLGHGIATLDVKSAAIEDDFEQSYHSAVQDISMPSTTGGYYFNIRPVTSIIDQLNWGLGIKLMVNNTNGAGSLATEPPHICQVMNLHLRTEGAIDA